MPVRENIRLRNARCLFPEDVAKRLDELARSLDRPRAYTVTKALREYLEEYEDYLIALHRLNAKDDRLVSEKELPKSGR